MKISNKQIIQEILADYVNAGFALVPIPQGQKGPVQAGWNLKEKSIRDLSNLGQIRGNVGLAHVYSDPITCAIDVDDVELAAEWLYQRGICLDDLLEAKDAVLIQSGKSNRAKLLYHLPSGVDPLLTRQVKDDEHMILEFRCASSKGKTVQDVLPPSIHPETGQSYRWAGSGHFSRLPVIPSRVLTVWRSLEQPKSSQHSLLKGDIPSYLQSADPDPVTLSLIGMPETPETRELVVAALDRISSDCTYFEWRDILYALKSTGWKSAEHLAVEWSMRAPHRWNQDAFDRIWNKANPFGGITIGTLFFKANQNPVGPCHSALSVQNPAGATTFLAPNNGKLTLLSAPPPKRSYLFGGGVMPGTPCILAGLGGTAKTTFIMQLAIHAAIGKGLGQLEIAPFGSILLLGEESDAERDRRFGGLCKDLTPLERAKVEELVLCFPASGLDLRLTTFEGHNLRATAIVSEVISLAEQHATQSNTMVGLIVLDHARLVMSGDPNDANDVTQLTRIMNDIATRTGAAVMLLAHSPKSAHGKEESTDASEVFGSSAFVDNVRTAFVLHTMRPKEAKEFAIEDSNRAKYVCLETVKANYGPQGCQWWFEKQYLNDWQIVRLEPAQLYSQKLFQNHSALGHRLIDLVKQYPAQLSERKIRDRAGRGGSLKASESEVLNSLRRLVEEGGLVDREPTGEERTIYKLSKNIKRVFVLGTAA